VFAVQPRTRNLQERIRQDKTDRQRDTKRADIPKRKERMTKHRTSNTRGDRQRKEREGERRRKRHRDCRQMGTYGCNEELAAVCVWPGVRHRQQEWPRVFVHKVLVAELFAVDGLTARALRNRQCVREMEREGRERGRESERSCEPNAQRVRVRKTHAATCREPRRPAKKCFKKEREVFWCTLCFSKSPPWIINCGITYEDKRVNQTGENTNLNEKYYELTSVHWREREISNAQNMIWQHINKGPKDNGRSSSMHTGERQRKRENERRSIRGGKCC